MFRWARSWHGGMKAGELVDIVASAISLACFVILASYALWVPAYRPDPIRIAAAVGVVSLLIRAGNVVVALYRHRHD